MDEQLGVFLARFVDRWMFSGQCRSIAVTQSSWDESTHTLHPSPPAYLAPTKPARHQATSTQTERRMDEEHDCPTGSSFTIVVSPNTLRLPVATAGRSLLRQRMKIGPARRRRRNRTPRNTRPQELSTAAPRCAYVNSVESRPRISPPNNNNNVEELKKRLESLERAVGPLLVKHFVNETNSTHAATQTNVPTDDRAVQHNAEDAGKMVLQRTEQELGEQISRLNSSFANRVRSLESRVDNACERLGNFERATKQLNEFKRKINAQSETFVSEINFKFDRLDNRLDCVFAKARLGNYSTNNRSSDQVPVNRLSISPPNVESLSRSMLESEVTSLRAILELKMNELGRMRCRCDQMKTEVVEASRLRDQLVQCAREKESMVALTRILQEKSRSAQIRCVRLNERLGRESITRKRLECENEQLKYTAETANSFNKCEENEESTTTKGLNLV